MTAGYEDSGRPLSPMQVATLRALAVAIERNRDPWASVEDIAAAGNMTLRQARRHLRALRRRRRANMVYPATRGRYWASWDDALEVQWLAIDRNAV